MRTHKPDVPLLAIGVGVLLCVVVWGAVSTESLNAAGSGALAWVLDNLGWVFVVAADFFLVLAVLLAFSRYGKVRLGKDDDTPEFSNLAWAAMMFSAGMGIGLMFYGVAEPMTHFLKPPPGLGIEAGTPEAARTAMEYTLFHWTLHPWAIYAITGLALAYSTFRKGRGNQFSAAFEPLFGKRVGVGRALDLLAVLATVFGTATSLGLGALQVEYGINELFHFSGRRLEVVIIVVLTAAFVISAATGVHGGVQWLSTTNVYLAGVLALAIFVFGPTVAILDLIPASVGGYVNDLIPMATRTGAFMDKAWLGSWTIFYWAWWLSWAPFVGAFIARISRGRTIREFIVGVMLVPSAASVIWFCVSGGSALTLQRSGAVDFAKSIGEGAEAAMFTLLDNLPFASVTTVIAVVLIALYFVTGADSASLVLGSLSSRGSLHPPRALVIMWGVLIGTVALVLLLAGGLQALQQATILVALPFVLVMLLLCAALVKELREDPGAGPLPARGHPYGLPVAIKRVVGDGDDFASSRLPKP
ncbi:BCCT family transporter [Nonomuraea sp. NPDC050556]|uniref:BCCT family transporter n=1 Tax=Nonomuraea sp. NPDC050556 TaxID=3364369 RepID=UPI0037A0E3AA